MAKVSPEPNTGCWLWTAAVFRRCGYGQFRQGYAHRKAYEMFVGQIPRGLCVLHSCDTPLCVNPDHLAVGTQKQNMQDASRRGRIAHGQRSGRAKISDADVRVIRASRDTAASLAAVYGVTAPTINAIRRRRTWKHVE